MTIDVEHSHVRFLGNLVLNLWDCGGQEAFMENYFASQRDHIFRNVEVLIYVFDIESMDHEKDLRHYRSSLEAILENSKEAKVFCLIHKMDLVPEEQRDEAFRRKEQELQGGWCPCVSLCLFVCVLHNFCRAVATAAHHVLCHEHLGRDALQGLVCHGLLAHSQRAHSGATFAQLQRRMRSR